MEWIPIENLPDEYKDGRWFAIKTHGHVEAGRYDPLVLEKYVEQIGGLYRKEEYVAFEWQGFNNFHAATHYCELPPV